MQQATIKIATTHTLHCPNCNGKIGTYDHLLSEFPREFGPWSCKNCDKSYHFKGEKDGTVTTIGTAPVQHKKGLCLLRFCDPSVNLWVVVEGLFFVDPETKEVEYDKTYYYNEHTCPVNYLNVNKVYYNADGDYHGLFVYVRGATYDDLCSTYGVTKDEILDLNNDYIETYFPELVQSKEPEQISNIGGIAPFTDQELTELKLLASKATQGEWWMDSHGCSLYAMENMTVVFRTNSDPATAKRHPETGNLSNWNNDWDASYIPTASPANIQRLIARLEAAEQRLAELNQN